MGDRNQFDWIQGLSRALSGPILEVGSRHYDSKTANNFRSLFPSQTYVGVDISRGENVDHIVDFTEDLPRIDLALEGVRFNTVLCMSVMEHVKDIFAFSRNLTSVVAPGGHLLLSVPFSWRFHGYPSDFWRFSPEGVRYLFPEFQFKLDRCIISSNIVGDVAPLTNDPNEFAVKHLKRNFASRLFFGRYPYLMKPTMLSFFGIRKA